MSGAERERAIQCLKYYGEKLGCKADFDLAIKALEDRPQGHWIKEINGYYCYFRCNQCSQCVSEKTKYCHNCGADMTGGEI
jgi:hypothetical protein